MDVSPLLTLCLTSGAVEQMGTDLPPPISCAGPRLGRLPSNVRNKNALLYSSSAAPAACRGPWPGRRGPKPPPPLPGPAPPSLPSGLNSAQALRFACQIKSNRAKKSKNLSIHQATERGHESYELETSNLYARMAVSSTGGSSRVTSCRSFA